MMIDTHAHLTDAQLAPDLDAVLSRARAAGIARIVCVSSDPSDYAHAHALHETHGPLVQPAAGLHPEVVARMPADELFAARAALRAAVAAHPATCVAVGEVGLDFTPRVLATSHPLSDSVARARQLEVFRDAIDVARAADLPLSVHSRGAGRHALDVLLAAHEAACLQREAGGTGTEDSASHERVSERGGRVRACMHAFDGRAVYAERALQRMPHGLYFSVPPVAAREPSFRKLVRRVPLDRLLLESDSPALPPVKGERNEPANLTVALRVVAEGKGVSVEEVASAMARNSHALFDRLPPETDGT